MPVLIYTESPLNPLQIVRYWPDAGLGFEKHRWLFPTIESPDKPERLFTFGDEPLREIYLFQTNTLGEPVEAEPLANYLTSDALPIPPLHFTLISEPETDSGRLVDTLISNWETQIYLVFSPALIPPFNPPPRHTNVLLEHILGQAWEGEKNPGYIPLTDPEMRQRAAQAIGVKGFHRLYLVAGSQNPATLSSHLQQLFQKGNGLTKTDNPQLEYRLFHELVSNYDWVLTSHGNVSEQVPFCFYSSQSLQATLQNLSRKTKKTLLEFDDINQLNKAAGIELKPRGGLGLSEIVPVEIIADATDLSLAWSNLDKLDGLPRLKTLKHLDLEGTLIHELEPLSRMPQLESLCLRCLQIKELQPLSTLPSLQSVGLNRIPSSGLSQLVSIPALNSLNLDGLPIENATLLTACQQLKNLSLDRTPLNRVDEIAEITSLEILSICSTLVNDINPLSTLQNLKELYLDDCDLINLAPLRHLKNLTTLSLAGFYKSPLQLPDISHLASMDKLKRLSLCNTTLDELPIGSLANTLEELDISASWTKNLERLTHLANLRKLEIERLKAPLEPLKELSYLESLNVSGCMISNLDWLRNLVKLHTLKLNSTEIANLRPIAELPHLDSLSLAGAFIDTSSNQSINPLNVLSNVSNLKELNLSGWQLGNFTGLSNLKQLRFLDLSHTDIEDTSCLDGMALLMGVNLSKTPLHSLEGLRNSHQLRYLHLNKTLINNLNPISSATALEELSLQDTEINDLTVLSNFKELKKLDLRGIPNTNCDFSPLLELPRLRLLCLDPHGIREDVLIALRQRHRVVITPT